LSGAHLVWTSSRQGVLGTGSHMATSGLSSGAHVLTLTAADSKGMSATASVSIFIGQRLWMPVIISGN
jgi:chitinase